MHDKIYCGVCERKDLPIGAKKGLCRECGKNWFYDVKNKIYRRHTWQGVMVTRFWDELEDRLEEEVFPYKWCDAPRKLLEETTRQQLNEWAEKGKITSVKALYVKDDNRVCVEFKFSGGDYVKISQGCLY